MGVEVAFNQYKRKMHTFLFMLGKTDISIIFLKWKIVMTAVFVILNN